MAPSTPATAEAAVAIVEQTEAPAEAPATGSGYDQAEFENDLARMGRALASQPKVEVKVQEDTTVSINGYQLQIKGKTKVRVPQQVAEILEEAGRI